MKILNSDQNTSKNIKALKTNTLFLHSHWCCDLFTYIGIKTFRVIERSVAHKRWFHRKWQANQWRRWSFMDQFSDISKWEGNLTVRLLIYGAILDVCDLIKIVHLFAKWHTALICNVMDFVHWCGRKDHNPISRCTARLGAEVLHSRICRLHKNAFYESCEDPLGFSIQIHTPSLCEIYSVHYPPNTFIQIQIIIIKKKSLIYIPQSRIYKIIAPKHPHIWTVWSSR